MGKEREGVGQQTSRHFTEVAQPKEPQIIAWGCVWGISGCVLWVASVVVICIISFHNPIKEEVIPTSAMIVFLAVLALPVCFLASAILCVLFRSFKG